MQWSLDTLTRLQVVSGVRDFMATHICLLYGSHNQGSALHATTMHALLLPCHLMGVGTRAVWSCGVLTRVPRVAASARAEAQHAGQHV